MQKIKAFLVLLLLSCWVLPAALFAQKQTISGKVVSDDQTPLAGVTISVKGSTIAALTDNSGAFSVQASVGQTLEVSYVGFKTQSFVIANGKPVQITLSRSSEKSQLDEVVVVGYGTQKKGNLTGAVATVDVNKTLTGRPIADVGRGLQGAVSGLSITIPSGEVGSDPLIKIRGQITSFQGSTKPLILLDNVEIPSIQVVNPNDIASISVLKDAAAASIYGAKASNGVILITTKKGSGTSKPQINYSNNFSWQNVWKDLQMADVDALKYTIDATRRIGITTPVGAFYYVDSASYMRAVAWKQKYGSTIGPDDPTVFGRDWYVQGANNQKMGVRTYNPYDYMVKEWAPTQQHDITIGQTLGKTSYNIGLGVLDQSGMIKPAKKMSLPGITPR